MQQDAAALAALIGSRICHDLISPIGAICNGLEMAELTATSPAGPEMSLIQQSCDHAAARIRFFRIAFGTARDNRAIPVEDARNTLVDHYASTRIRAEWHMAHGLGRDATQIGYLSALCVEAALPQGGTIRVMAEEDHLVTIAEADHLRDSAALWAILLGGDDAHTQDIGPNHAQFALLGRICADRGLTPERRLTQGSIALRVPVV